MQGQLFTQDFLRRGICETPPYQALDADALIRFRDALGAIYAPLRSDSNLNEANTEQLVIERVLVELGWGADFLSQTNLSPKRREDVPDFLLFADAASMHAARNEPREDRRYRHGLAILEAKRWMRPLDRGDAAEATDPGAPSSQMLRYLSRADVVSDRAVKWGLLTNGAVWRLYYQDARSRAEEFFEIDLALALGVPGVQDELDGIEPEHALKLFFLLFNREAFLLQSGWDSGERTFHAFALNEARLYEEKVSQDLGARVFTEIFPRLAQALADGDLQAQKQKVGYGQFIRDQYTREYLDEVRESALIFLYRLLFLFYAEDRHLLPVRDPRYRDYSVRRLRERVRDEIDAGKVFATRLDNIWRDLKGVFLLIDEGDDAVGMPAYNGGLFDRARAPLLERTRVPDAVMAPLIDALSRRTEDLLRAWINYRDLAVSHLGGIYERLLEYTLVHEVQAADDYRDKPEINRITARPASFARKVSGSYYTHDDLVRLILRESVGLLARERLTAFEAQIAKYKKKASLNPADWDVLGKLDPGSAILELKVCDPAMGSGHFLVALVDDLADRVLEAVNTAEQLVAEQPWAAHLAERGQPWLSPVVARVAHIRQTIRRTANEHRWAVTDAQLDDRHIVRRMILKKTIFGVDKNPMAVELAKTALWLHTFTVGAPLSFLDHHLKCGDSLHGERLDTVQRGMQSLGMLFQMGELNRLDIAAKSLEQVADFTDVDIAEAQRSKTLSAEAQTQVAPLHALLDFWRALRWLVPGWPVDSAKKLSRLGGGELSSAFVELLSPSLNLIGSLATGRLDGAGEGIDAANQLIAEAGALARRERFFHWWTAFPTVFKANGTGGFDIVLGNPPWDMLQMQEVEWFSERVAEVAMQTRGADRKRLVNELKTSNPTVWAEFEAASLRSDQEQRVVRSSGDFPMLAEGRSNLYKLFVERAQALVRLDGVVALLTPSGIAADKGAAEFFRSLSTTSRLGALFDFENRFNPPGSFFPDVDGRFKFSTILFGGVRRQFSEARCAFYLHQTSELDDPARVLTLTAEDFALVNPNTGAAPIFRTKRDADITKLIYRSSAVLVAHLPRGLERAWPIKFAQGTFNMTADSKQFKTRVELTRLGFSPSELGQWRNHGHTMLPLYEGKMVQMYDHRAADVVVHADNLHRAAQPEAIQPALKEQPDRYPTPQFWIDKEDANLEVIGRYCLAFKDVTSPTNARTMIAAMVPSAGFGNTLPLLIPDGDRAEQRFPLFAPILLANLASMAFDYIARQKVQGQHLNWFILEQLPVIAAERFESAIGGVTIAHFIRDQVLHLSYTAYDLAPFARDLGHVNADGSVKPPFVWNYEDRRVRLAALDGLFMNLYGLNEDDAAYVLDTFPIVREQDIAAFGRYRTKEDVLAQLRRIGQGTLAL
jgi:hypothetical protein